MRLCDMTNFIHIVCEHMDIPPYKIILPAASRAMIVLMSLCSIACGPGIIVCHYLAVPGIVKYYRSGFKVRARSN